MTLSRLRFLTVALLILFPLAWVAPLASARVLPLFSGTEISVFSGLRDLLETDLFLAGVIATFAVALPYAKLITLLAAQSGWLPRARLWVGAVDLIGKFSMADVFLIAVYVVIAKGIGFGSITVEWGLYLFTALVIASIALAFATKGALHNG